MLNNLQFKLNLTTPQRIIYNETFSDSIHIHQNQEKKGANNIPDSIDKSLNKLFHNIESFKTGKTSFKHFNEAVILISEIFSKINTITSKKHLFQIFHKYSTTLLKLGVESELIPELLNKIIKTTYGNEYVNSTITPQIAQKRSYLMLKTIIKQLKNLADNPKYLVDLTNYIRYKNENLNTNHVVKRSPSEITAYKQEKKNNPHPNNKYLNNSKQNIQSIQKKQKIKTIIKKWKKKYKKLFLTAKNKLTSIEKIKRKKLIKILIKLRKKGLIKKNDYNYFVKLYRTNNPKPKIKTIKPKHKTKDNKKKVSPSIIKKTPKKIPPVKIKPLKESPPHKNKKNLTSYNT